MSNELKLFKIIMAASLRASGERDPEFKSEYESLAKSISKRLES